MKCTVYAVVIPPMQRGTAYAHTKTGKCITFTGRRSRMIALCEEVRRYNIGERDAVRVDTKDWHKTQYVEQSQCFAHLERAA